MSRRPRRGPSLTRALLTWLLLPLVALVPLAGWLLYVLTVQPALDALDRSLGSTAVALAGMIETDPAAPAGVRLALDAPTARALHVDPVDTVYFVVLGPAGQVLGGDAPLAALAALPIAAGAWRFDDAALGGRPIRLVEHGVGCGPAPSAAPCRVRVGESLGKRHAAERQVLAGTAIAMTVVALALATLGGVSVWRALRPLRRLGQQLEGRSLENLQPLDGAGVPREAAPIVSALNRLFDRLRIAAQAQQQFLADAAHQLRTPLTVLRTDAELALREPHAPEIDPALRRLAAGAGRVARLANQLLSLARAGDAAQSTPPEAVALHTLCAEVAEDWVEPALAAGIDLGFELEPATVHGRAWLLRELLANLLHNAVAHAGAGARVTVRVVAPDGAAGAVRLEVEDDGPGIAPDERERAWERFHRGAATGTAATGTGLGLAIVRDIARSHGAAAQLLDGPAGRGLTVRLTFPPAPPPAPPR